MQLRRHGRHEHLGKQTERDRGGESGLLRFGGGFGRCRRLGLRLGRCRRLGLGLGGRLRGCLGLTLRGCLGLNRGRVDLGLHGVSRRHGGGVRGILRVDLEDGGLTGVGRGGGLGVVRRDLVVGIGVDRRSVGRRVLFRHRLGGVGRGDLIFCCVSHIGRTPWRATPRVARRNLVRRRTRRGRELTRSAAGLRLVLRRAVIARSLLVIRLRRGRGSSKLHYRTVGRIRSQARGVFLREKRDRRRETAGDAVSARRSRLPGEWHAPLASRRRTIPQRPHRPTVEESRT